MRLFKRAKKYHWWRMVHCIGPHVYAENTGSVKKKITNSLIIKSRAYSGAPCGALFVSASYLGHMTEDEFMAE